MFNALGISLDQISPNEGSLVFRSSKPTSLLQGEGPVRLLEVGKNGYTLILDRRNQGELVFMRGRPHLPTRIARYSVADPASVNELFVAITWSPIQDVLYVGDGRSNEPAAAVATETENISFRIAPDGSITQIGDEGIQVSYFRITEGGEVTESTAKELFDWKLERAKVVIEHCDKIDFIFETTLLQLLAATVVAALEQYGRDRFVEMADEGWTCDLAALIEEFVPIRNRRAVQKEISTAARKQDKSELVIFIQEQRRISFQAWDRFKKAYKLGYGIAIWELGLGHDVFDALDATLRLRRKVIHVKGDHSVVNSEEVPAAGPVFANRAFAENGLVALRTLGDKLHQATIWRRG